MNQTAFDPYLKWLGIRTPQRPPDHYALLGLRAFEDDSDVIANAADRQMAHVKTFQSGQFAELSQRLLNELAAAQVCLLNPAQKQAYDQRLKRNTAEEKAQWAETAELDAEDLRDLATAPTVASAASEPERPAIVVSDRPVTRRRRRGDYLPLLLLLGVAAAVGGLGWYVYTQRQSEPLAQPPSAVPAPLAPTTSAESPEPPQSASGGTAGSSGGAQASDPRTPNAAPPTAAAGDGATAAGDGAPLASALNNFADDAKPDRRKVGVYTGPVDVLNEAERALQTRDINSAEAFLLLAKLPSQKVPALAARWRELNEIHQTLQTFVTSLKQTIIELKGTAEIEQAGKRWRILDMHAGRLAVAGPGGQQMLNLADVPADALAALVRQGSRGADPPTRRSAVVLLLFDPRTDLARAEQELEKLSLLMPVADDPLLQTLLEAAKNRPGQAARNAAPLTVTEITLTRAPWPTAEALQAALEKVRQTYAEPIAAADNDEGRVRLVATLVTAARDASLLAVERAAVLEEALAPAILSGNADALAAVVAVMDEHFRIDRFEREGRALADALQHARSPLAQEALILRALEVGRRAAVARELDQAQQLTALATGAAKKHKLVELQAHAKAQAAEIRRWQARQRELKQAWADDEAGQASPQQSLALGQFLCFEQQDWPLGLVKLAHGADEKLAALAERDVKTPTDAGDRLRLADDWQQAAEHSAGRQRAAARQRAAYWYQLALGPLTGLDRTRVMQRLAQWNSDERSNALGASPLVRAVPPERLVVLPHGAALRLKLIPAGTFLMGPPGRAHEVTLSRPFYLAVTETTVGQWNALRPQNPRPDDRNAEAAAGGLSWDDCQEFLESLKQLPAESPLVARLPTEAEWEYACRAGTTTHYSFGDNPQGLPDYAWFNSGTEPNRVAQRRANDWGLFDLHGNVWEWCQDRSGDYLNQPQTDPQGQNWGDHRVLRGGGFRSRAEQCRSHQRLSDLPASGKDDYGFRVVVEF